MTLHFDLPPPIHKLLRDTDLELEAPYTCRIFTNRSLPFEQVPYIGFDMDYTLAIYNQAELEALSIECTAHKLIAQGYPEKLLEIKSDPLFSIRGLLVDKRYGNVIKSDRYGYIVRAYHGKHKLPREERKALYRTQRLGTERARFSPVDTLFSLPEVTIYAELVDLIDHFPEAWGASGPPSYEEAWDDVRRYTDQSHHDGSLKEKIKADLNRYFFIDPQLGSTLHKFRTAGKKLFLLTNSFFPYTDAVLSHLLHQQHQSYDRWQAYFDWIVVGARKPYFFSEGQPFQELDEQGNPTGLQVQKPERGRIYEGGNQLGLQAALGVHSDQVLYVGDHIYSDIVHSKKSSGWRTALVVEDLEHDLAVRKGHRNTLEEIHSLAKLRINLTDEITSHRYLASLLARMTPGQISKMGVSESQAQRLLEESRSRVRKRFEYLRKYEQETADTLQRRIDMVNTAFNPYWGSIFEAKQNTSRFGSQVENYACIYTSRVTNFRFISPVNYFHAHPGALPHWQNKQG